MEHLFFFFFFSNDLEKSVHIFISGISSQLKREREGVGHTEQANSRLMNTKGTGQSPKPML